MNRRRFGLRLASTAQRENRRMKAPFVVLLTTTDWPLLQSSARRLFIGGLA